MKRVPQPSTFQCLLLEKLSMAWGQHCSIFLLCLSCKSTIEWHGFATWKSLCFINQNVSYLYCNCIISTVLVGRIILSSLLNLNSKKPEQQLGNNVTNYKYTLHSWFQMRRHQMIPSIWHLYNRDTRYSDWWNTRIHTVPNHSVTCCTCSREMW